MKKTFGDLCKCSIIAIAMVAFLSPAHAALATRPTAANNAAAARAKSGVRTPTTISQSAPKVQTTEPEPEPVVTPEPEPEPEAPIIVNNKTSMFQDVMSEIGASATEESNNELADAIRRQRALLDGAANAESAATGVNMGTAAACDSALRKCMSEKCGNDFSKCANDSSTIWGQKIDGCRTKTECTGHEYSLIAPEILADRDMNVRMAHYNSVINCGNKYNNCIFAQCGTTLHKCLAKKDGDNAISKCASIANECKAMDNGLASRAMGVFGNLRTIATARVKADEARLYELRNLMRDQCNRFGAMFDERTLDCVYTVNFFAGEDNTLMASKKLYSGDSFQCNANWFGVDITTYIENAQRLTRSQKSASSAALGAGLGTAAGMLSSGAIGRAINTQTADRAVKAVENEKECTESGGTWDGKKCTDADGNEIEFDENGNIITSSNRDNPYKNRKTECEKKVNDGYEWDSKNEECKFKCADGQKWENNECTAAKSPAEETIEEELEEENGNVDCSKLKKEITCKTFRAKKCWWNGNQCVDASEKENTVDITNLQIQDDRTGKIPLFATLECNGKKSRTSTSITLTKIPKDATCKISAAGCITKKDIGAEQLAGAYSFQLHCNLIDDCIDRGGTWERNKNNNDGTCVAKKVKS